MRAFWVRKASVFAFSVIGFFLVAGCGEDTVRDDETGTSSLSSDDGPNWGKDTTASDSGSAEPKSTDTATQTTSESSDGGPGDSGSQSDDGQTDPETETPGSQTDPASDPGPDTETAVPDTQTGSADTDVDTGQSCTSSGFPRCKDLETALACEGGVITSTTCEEGYSCCEGQCLEQICAPNGDWECIDDTTYQLCNTCGTELVELECRENFYCDPAAMRCQCEYPINIMFVVDASGSMELRDVGGVSQWRIAREAIAKVMVDYPRLVYGLSTFPSETVTCSGEGQCAGGGGCELVGGVNFDLGAVSPSEIILSLEKRDLADQVENLKYVKTPLVGIFDYFVSGYPTDGPVKDHSYPSYIVLISDGEDSCYNPVRPKAAVGPLGDRVRTLVDDWGVKTFAIGFNLDSGQDQLDAVSMNGGTGRASYIPASDIDSLKSALASVLDTINPRSCEGEDPLREPDCAAVSQTDADGDGWCSGLDCDDADPGVRPGAIEAVGNGVDDNCDGFTDVPEMQIDDDGDGAVEPEDCNDFEALIGPAALEVKGDGLDNDCDGLVDEAETCACAPVTGQSAAALSCAAELSCDDRFFDSSSVSSPTGATLLGEHDAYGAVGRFGSSSNALAPRAGSSYAMVGTGDVTDVTHSDELSGSGYQQDEHSSDENVIYDAVEHTVSLRAPANAKGFSIDYVFFSAEYDEYIGSEFNDKFYIFLEAPTTTGGQRKIINFTDCRYPDSYHDFAAPECTLAGGYCCYIAVNTALSECCWYNDCSSSGNTDISGTGYSCGSYEDEAVCTGDGWGNTECEPDVENGYKTGSSTGWLKTTWSIAPGEAFELVFHIHDTSDQLFDSQVILDNFTWHTAEVTPGTEPVD